MQFSEQWLRSMVNPAMDTEQLGHALTMAGLEVEALTPVAPAFSRVVVAEILEAAKHPDADRLQVCKVKVGEETLQIVCGAPNARAGLKAPCALVGAQLPENNGQPGIQIKQAKVRGVESFGMMCSAKELGIATEANGILELPADAPVGQDIREYLDLNDHAYTLKLTPNRADCLSIVGIARDVVAMTGAPMTAPTVAPAAVTGTLTKNVTLQASTACLAYYGRVIEGVNAQAKTPDWMVRRLERSGIRSISALVDITNYILLEQGQPLHAFDLNLLQGDIQVRFAQAGEKLVLLNDTEVTLKGDDLVIADSNGPVALAGIMGGNPSAVSDTTQAIFLESAFFTPDVMAGKARRLGLSTDSSYRFERGVDFGNTLNALERATALVLEICGGQAAAVTAVTADLPVRKQVSLRYAYLLSVLGIEISLARVGQLLTQLGFSYTESNGVFQVNAPSFRFDIAREEDLIEEVARLHGYEHIPALTPVAPQGMLASPEAQRSKHWLRDVMVNQGYQEVVTYSFVDASWERDLYGNEAPITLKNPIASNLSVMRSGLWGGLLDALDYNLKRQQTRAMLFELGARYEQGNQGFIETLTLSGLIYGSVQPEQWATEARAFDFYDAKAHVESLFAQTVRFVVEQHPALHPGQSARIYLGDQAVGWLGKLHPQWQQQYGLTSACYLFELDAAAALATQVPAYGEVSKFLPVRRDLAVIVDQNVSAQTMIDAIIAEQIPQLQTLKLFDVYQGKGVPENKKSLAFLVLMQDTCKTMVDEEVDTIVARILNNWSSNFAASLR
ncbi:phenylalanine--tRNA ligase subunit beta [Methylophilus sp. VKM B-3414]|uniref:phenylalanine--tRNA ligase subunit beta n=1 Tax=Methylophilus sp. VKM B-3414 TaxID=3076121 RepID=UPI0028C958A4|nr:phenylalanine--tRNA ligase subunit beta [Methylophilus sp. VKM B-3414]MDT7849407.1 phenylalanine--tRNA ligase subunit beta [Methylophilus sp. VKM B-3414]